MDISMLGYATTSERKFVNNLLIAASELEAGNKKPILSLYKKRRWKFPNNINTFITQFTTLLNRVGLILLEESLRKYSMGKSKSSEEYNGWTNWETWNTFNWISSNENFYNISKEFSHSENLLKDFIMSLALEACSPGLFTDLLFSSLNKINYKELAEALKE